MEVEIEFEKPLVKAGDLEFEGIKVQDGFVVLGSR